MSAATRGRKRDLVRFVPINDVFLYGWATVDLAAATGVSAADLTTQLGHLTPEAAGAGAGTVLVLGCNAPKPARAVKKLANATTATSGSVSTFVAYNKKVAAVGGGWNISGNQRSVRLRAASAGKRSVTAVATLSNGLLYAFAMNAADFALVGGDLGLQGAAQISSLEAKKLATGMTSTRPGRAAIEDSGGMLSSFYTTASRDTAAAAGFDILSDEKVLFPGAAPAP